MTNPTPNRPQVTLETVGDFYSQSPLAYSAVNARISQPEFIRLLLEENARLLQAAIDAERRAMPRTLNIND